MAPRAKKSAAAAVVTVTEAPAPAIPAVTEAELRSIIQGRKDVADLRASIRATEKRLAIEEDAIIKRLRGGAKVEGKLVAIVEMVKGRITVSWKDVAMKLAVKCGLNPVAVEQEERKLKEAELVPEPSLLITGDAVEQYVGSEVGK